jgi:hypothetical protein
VSAGQIPAFKWGASYVNTLTFGYPLYNGRAYSDPSLGSERARAPSGVMDAWKPGDDQVLEGDARWIPTTDSSNPVATGWDGATGWREFLEWARDANVVRFVPDKDTPGTYIESYLLEPWEGPPGREDDDGTKQVHLKLLSTGTAFSGF